MPKVKILVWFLVFAPIGATWAKLGESPIQCYRRYGGKVTGQGFVGGAEQVLLQSDGWRISSLFARNKAAFLVFRKAGSLSEADARSFLQKHGMDVAQVPETRCHVRVGNKLLEAVRWELPDSTAMFSPLRNSITVCDPDFSKTIADGSYGSADGMREFREISQKLNSSTPLTSGEVAVLEASFASEAASRRAEKTALEAALASRKAALSALQAQERAMQAQARALDSQKSAVFARDPHGSTNERRALEDSRRQILEAKDSLATEAQKLRSEISSLMNERRTIRKPAD